MTSGEPPTTAIGYHGTSSSAAESILKEGFRISRNSYDWLGDGVYFFQEAPQRAWDWALQFHPDAPAVVAAEIRIVDCIDLLDAGWASFMKEAYNFYVRLVNLAGEEIPEQAGGNHRLDREVMNYAVGVLGNRGTRVACARSAFAEGHPVYPNSAILDQSHVQIAVRDTERCIQRVWSVSPPTLVRLT
jgi:hypothetical protein